MSNKVMRSGTDLGDAVLLALAELYQEHPEGGVDEKLEELMEAYDKWLSGEK